MLFRSDGLRITDALAGAGQEQAKAGHGSTTEFLLGISREPWVLLLIVNLGIFLALLFKHLLRLLSTDIFKCPFEIGNGHRRQRYRYQPHHIYQQRTAGWQYPCHHT